MRICPECNAKTEELICPVCSSRTITEDEYVELHADPDGLIGKVLMERYQVTRLVGIGGMGNVYEARHKLFDKRFAVKVIKRTLVENREALRRFQREALLASKMDHPNIVKVYDFGETPTGQQFILMEYVDGESLRDMMKRQPQMPPFQVAVLFLQLAKAMEYAHNKKLLHRDLKPDNILVRHINDEDFIKIMDFGVAKLLQQEDSNRPLTMDGHTPGTPEYMSPEQVLGKSDIDARSDLYSMGLIVYEMLSGIRPFKRETALASAVAHLRENAPPFPKEVRARLPKGLESLVFQLIERKPSKRPQSATEVISRLKQLRFETGEYSGENGALMTPRDTKALTPFNTTDLSNKVAQVSTAHNVAFDYREPAKKGMWKMLGIIGAGLLIAAVIVFWPRSHKKATDSHRIAPRIHIIAKTRAIDSGFPGITHRRGIQPVPVPAKKAKRKRYRRHRPRFRTQRVRHIKKKSVTKPRPAQAAPKKVYIPKW